jgi:mono/diheme cytochrome c family protein
MGADLPRWIKPLGVAVGFVALVPFAVIARARITPSAEPRYHIIRDMDNQLSYRQQQRNDLFADGRAMRPPVPGTVARGEAELDDLYWRGLKPDAASNDPNPYADEVPARLTVDRKFLERGRERFTIYCAVCHGQGGYGDGMVHKRAVELTSKGRAGMEWVPPSNYNTAALRDKPVGYIFHVITNGVRNMAPYGPQIPVADRWAIACYVKALQRANTPEN